MVGDDPGADMLGLLLHLLHQPGTLDDVGEAWIVFYVGSDGELTAGLDALDHDRLQHGARRIDRGGVASRARADDYDLGMGCLGHFKAAPWRASGAHRPAGPVPNRR